MIVLSTVLKKLSIRHHDNQGITICTVADSAKGLELTELILEVIVDKKTALYLSGGSTPKALYESIAKKEVLVPGAVGMVDERFGKKWHKKSNELMLQQTGILRYLQMLAVPFYPILEDETREETADRYDQKVRELTMTYQQSVGILGIGTDGHTSSIIPNRADFHNPWFNSSQKHLMVSEFSDLKSDYKERVGMTFLGLSMLDILLVPVFGPAKQDTLEKVFEDGTDDEIPARFFKRPDIAKKTLFITDQRV